MTPPTTHPPHDIAIIGGGLVGASLALALEPTGLSVAVVEPVAAEGGEARGAGYDERTVALTDNARRIYTDLGVWERLMAQPQPPQPIREIHISDRGHFGMTHLSHADMGGGVEALGYVVPTRTLGGELHRRLRDSDTITLHCPATAERLQARESDIAVSLAADAHNAPSTTLSARLAVLADGGRSPLASQMGIQSGTTDYRQSAILSVVATDRDHRGRAYERFTDEGPLALLPHSERRYAVVWSTAWERVAARMALSDAAFIAALQTAFGERAGTFSEPSARTRYSLQHGITRRPIGARTVTIGNAAHTVHPVAGQGFNLGLRDVAALAEVIRAARARRCDIGGRDVLEEYAALRRRETARVSGFTDGLIRVFGSRRAPVKLARNLALAGIELCPPAKRFLLRRTMGRVSGARVRSA